MILSEIEYKIAEIKYTEREDGSFTYNFTPCYSVIDLLSPPVFQGIPGGSEVRILQELAPSAKRLTARYKTYETAVEIDGNVYRAVVIHSSSHDRRQQKKVKKQLAASQNTLEKDIRKLQTEFFCEADAQRAVDEARRRKGQLHVLDGEVQAYAARRPGRPPKDQPASTVTRYSRGLHVQGEQGGHR